MIVSILYIIIAIALLYFGAKWLVNGSSVLALKAGVSPLVAGLTVVAFGTSSPELVVSLNAAASNQGNMAIGNIIGSNIFNIAIILGISSLFANLKVKLQLLKFDIPIVTAVTILFFIIFSDRHMSRLEGLIFLLILTLYIWFTIYKSRKEKNEEVLQEYEEIMPPTQKKWYLTIGLILAGLALLVGGSELLIMGSVDIAQTLGVSDTIISITILAAGTSLPELASSIVATMKKEYDIAIGNVIGSNIFNILGIAGISSIVKPMNAIAISNINLYIMTGITLLLYPFLRSHYALKRDEGFFMILIYLAYIYYLWPK